MFVISVDEAEIYIEIYIEICRIEYSGGIIKVSVKVTMKYLHHHGIVMGQTAHLPTDYDLILVKDTCDC